MAKKKVIPIITGINGKPVERKLIKLHYHPDMIKGLLHGLVEGTKEDIASYNLLIDVEVLVHWALDRLPIVPPPDKKPASDKSDTGNKTD